MANWTSVKMSDLNKHKYMRMDAKYWILKALLKKRKKEEMNKAHPSAASLYIGTGFAHIRS